MGGFILLPVTLGLLLVATIALLMNWEGAGLAARGDAEFQAMQAQYLARAALEQQSWRLRRANCTGYTNLTSASLGANTSASLGANSYSTTVSTTSGSPVTVTATGTTATGASRTLKRSGKAYQTATTNLVLQPDAATGVDGWIDSKKTTVNYGVDTKLWLVGSPTGRPLLQFDLSSLPQHAKIASAQLQLYTATLGAASNVYVHRVTRSWVEGSRFGSGAADGATWNSSDGTNTNNWIAPGGDFDTRRAATATVSANSTWYAFDITDLVTDWVTGNQLNYGVLLEEGSTATNMSFASSDNGNASLNPKLSLDYVCECGQTCSPPTAPIAHWLLDENSGLLAADAVGGHTGTLNGGTWTTGKITGGLFLDGTNTNYVSVANAADLSPTSFTLAAWIKPVSLTGIDTILNKGTSGTNRQYWLGTNGNQISFGWYNGALQAYTTTTANLQTNTWYHIAASYDASSKAVKVYLNGTLLLTQTATVLPATNAQGITLGKSPAGEYWQGVMDDVWIQQGALSAAQIAALAGTPSPGTPVTVTLTATADTSLSSGSKNTNYGTDPTLYLGGDLSGNQRWALLAFDGVSAIPAGATIVSATLSLYEIAHGGSTAIIMDAKPIGTSWVETSVTWKSAPTLGATVLDSASVNNGNGWKTWDVTPLVQEWVDAISPNYGIGLLREAGSGAPNNNYNSRESTAAEKPKLVVTYQ